MTLTFAKDFFSNLQRWVDCPLHYRKGKLVLFFYKYTVRGCLGCYRDMIPLRLLAVLMPSLRVTILASNVCFYASYQCEVSALTRIGKYFMRRVMRVSGLVHT